MKKLLKRLWCRHEYRNAGWSYIECKKCEKVKYDPKRNRELLDEYIARMPKEWQTRAEQGLIKRGVK